MTNVASLRAMLRCLAVRVPTCSRHSCIAEGFSFPFSREIKTKATAIEAVTGFTERLWSVNNKSCACSQGRPPLHLLCPVVPGNVHQEQQEASRAPLHHWRETSEALSGSGEEQGCRWQDPQRSCQASSEELGGEDCTVKPKKTSVAFSQLE